MNSDFEIIKGRLTRLFKRRPQTRYWLMLTNDTYDQTYNLFFNSQRANERLQSVPLHKLDHYDLADLEKLLKALRQDIKLTIEFVGFIGERWPASFNLASNDFPFLLLKPFNLLVSPLVTNALIAVLPRALLLHFLGRVKSSPCLGFTM